MVRLRHYNFGNAQNSLQKRSQSTDDETPPAPRSMTESIKRKTMSAAKPSTSHSIFGIFSHPVKTDSSSTSYTKGVTESLRSQSQRTIDASQRRPLWTLFNIPTLRRSDNNGSSSPEMSENRDVKSPVLSKTRSQTVLKTVRSRISFEKTQGSNSILTRTAFRPWTFRSTGTSLHRKRTAFPSFQSRDASQIDLSPIPQPHREELKAPHLSVDLDDERPILEQPSNGEIPEAPLEYNTYTHKSKPLEIFESEKMSASRMTHSEDSVKDMVEKELGPFEAEESMLSMSPDLDVPAIPAIRFPRATNSGDSAIDDEEENDVDSITDLDISDDAKHEQVISKYPATTTPVLSRETNKLDSAATKENIKHTTTSPRGIVRTAKPPTGLKANQASPASSPERNLLSRSKERRRILANSRNLPSSGIRPPRSWALDGSCN